MRGISFQEDSGMFIFMRFITAASLISHAVKESYRGDFSDPAKVSAVDLVLPRIDHSVLH